MGINGYLIWQDHFDSCAEDARGKEASQEVIAGTCRGDAEPVQDDGNEGAEKQCVLTVETIEFAGVR